MSENKHDHSEGGDCSACSANLTNPSLHQNLDEMTFERSIFQAGIDNNVTKIMSLSRTPGFDVNAVDNYGYTTLHYASRNGSLDAAKCLVKLGANINMPTTSLKATALHRAVTAKKVEMVRYLLSVGADPDLLDADGLSPKDRADKDKLHEIITAFKEGSQ